MYSWSVLLLAIFSNRICTVYAALQTDAWDATFPPSHRCNCTKYALISTQRSGTTSLGRKLEKFSNMFIYEATNLGAHSNAPYKLHASGIWRMNAAPFMRRVWEWQDNKHRYYGRCFDAEQRRCAVGASLLSEHNSAASLLPLFNITQISHGPKILVLERKNILHKWFSRERACVTDDWSGNHSQESDLRTIEYHKNHGPCYMTLREFVTKHNIFYDTLRPACKAMGVGCRWIYTHQLREINLPGSDTWSVISGFLRLPKNPRVHGCGHDRNRGGRECPKNCDMCAI